MGDYVQEIRRREHGEPPNQMRIARFLIDNELDEETWSGQWSRLPQPACKVIVNNLPEVKILVDSKECSICLVEFKKYEVVKQMPCLHLFHTLCIVTWLNQNNTCPFCRHRLPAGLH